MDETAPKLSQLSGSHLVQQDIHLTRESRQGEMRVVARVECARRGCLMEVEQCACCPHFARIEVHEAGYLMLCRAHEEHAPEDTEPNEPAF